MILREYTIITIIIYFNSFVEGDNHNKYPLTIIIIINWVILMSALRAGKLLGTPGVL